MSIFNKFLFGNDNIQLPQTRFKQLFYIIKQNFLLLFYSGIISFIFLMPTLYVVMSSYSRYYQLISSSNEIDANKILELFYSTGSLLIITIPIAGIGFAGMYNIIIKLVFNDGASLKDFFKGIKKHFLMFLLIYLVEGLLLFFLLFNYATYYYVFQINKYIRLFSLIISIIFLTLYLLIKPFLIVLLLIFKNKLTNIIKNSFLLMFSKFFKSILILLIDNVLYFLLLFFIGAPLIITMILIILFQFSYSSLINALFVIDTYEQLVDKSNYIEIYHKGLEDFKNAKNEF